MMTTDNAYFQVPADIAENKITDGTTLSPGESGAGAVCWGGRPSRRQEHQVICSTIPIIDIRFTTIFSLV